jgi:outer membrane receptor for ferrienterochelin and colicins
MKNIFALLLIVLLATYAFGTTISGRVIDEKTGQALAGANVFIKNTQYGASTDGDGYFSFIINDKLKGRFKLITTYIGYYDNMIDLLLPAKKDNFIIKLKESLLSMDQIVVTGTRGERFLKDTPVTTQVIKGEAISENGGNSAADLLNEATGITIEQHQRFGSTVNLQGFDSNHILFLVNGIKVIGRLNGQFDISQLSAADIERIEILKGPTSALYGSQAMGGVINIITKKPADAFRFNIDAKYGSYERLNSDVNISYPLGNWTSKLSLGMRRFGGCNLDPSTELEDCRAFDKYNTELQIDGNISPFVKLNMSGTFFKEEQNRNLSAIFGEKINNDRQSARITATIDSLMPFSLRTNLSYEHYDHEYAEIVRSSGYVKSSDPTSDDFLQFLTLLDKEWKNHLFQFGYSLEYDAIQSLRVTGGERNSLLHGIFVSDEFKTASVFTIQAGARLDIHSIYGQELSPKLSLMAAPGHTSRLRLSYGHGFRAPSFKELYLKLYVSDVNLTIEGNPLLRPERSNSINLDYEFWNTDNYHVRLNFYYNLVKDLISDIRISGNGRELAYTYHNFGRVKTWGAEWEMKYFPLDWFEITLGYNYMNSWVEETGQPLSGKAHHKGQAGILFTVPWDIKINFRALYFGPKTDTQINEETGEVIDRINVADYTMLNLNISKSVFKHFKINAGGRNLTNYVNNLWGPLPGREFYIGLGYSF